MSEEAVRQTRSQKRALERDAAPQSVEPPEADNESKKPKLDPSESTEQVQTTPKPDPDPAAEQADQSPAGTGSEPEPSRPPAPLVLPLASQPTKDEGAPKQPAEADSDNQTGCNDRGVKPEPAVDGRTRLRTNEPKAADSMLAAGEVKATIKVEVQTGEQPVDMSTSKG